MIKEEKPLIKIDRITIEVNERTLFIIGEKHEIFKGKIENQLYLR